MGIPQGVDGDPKKGVDWDPKRGWWGSFIKNSKQRVRHCSKKRNDDFSESDVIDTVNQCNLHCESDASANVMEFAGIPIPKRCVFLMERKNKANSK